MTPVLEPIGSLYRNQLAPVLEPLVFDANRPIAIERLTMNFFLVTYCQMFDRRSDDCHRKLVAEANRFPIQKIGIGNWELEISDSSTEVNWIPIHTYIHTHTSYMINHD